MRRRRMLTGLDAVASSVLALVLLAIVNYLGFRFDRAFDWTRGELHSLDPRTLSLLRESVPASKDKVRVALFSAPDPRFAWEGQLVDRVRGLLDRYQTACPALDLQVVDLYGAPERAKALADDLLKGPPEPNSVVFKCGERVKSVSASEMADVDFPDRIRAFKAEDAFTTALRTVLLEKAPRILLVDGHGERTLAEEKNPAGFQLLKELFERAGLPLKPGPLGPEPLEGRWDLVVVAGPTRALDPVEVDRLHQFLLKGGRLLLFLDPLPASDRKGLVPTGLEALASRWGVTARDELVIDPKRGRVGPEGQVISYVFSTNVFAGDSRITKGMGPNTPLLFCAARPLEVGEGAVPMGLRALPLVKTENSAWAKNDLRDLVTGVLKPDPSMDRRGPHTLAVQVEVRPEDVPAKLPDGYTGPAPLPADVEKGGRAVLIGDADLAATQVLLGGAGANADFLFNAVYWLLDQEGSMGISSKSDVIEIHLEEDQLKTTYNLAVWGIPGAFLLTGILLWWLRRQ